VRLETILAQPEWKGATVRFVGSRPVRFWTKARKMDRGKKRPGAPRLTYWHEWEIVRPVFEVQHPSGAWMQWWGPTQARDPKPVLIP
jgi:hypothetical protein